MEEVLNIDEWLNVQNSGAQFKFLDRTLIKRLKDGFYFRQTEYVCIESDAGVKLHSIVHFFADKIHVAVKEENELIDERFAHLTKVKANELININNLMN